MKQTETHFRTTIYIENKTHEKLKEYRLNTGTSLAHIVRVGIKMFMQSPEFKEAKKGK